MGIRSSGAKSLTLVATAAAGEYGSIPGTDGATAIKSFLRLNLGTEPARLANPFLTANAFDEIFEANTGIVISNRVVLNTKVPVAYSGQTIVLSAPTVAVQMGMQVKIAADGTCAPATADTDRLGGLAMYDAGIGEIVHIVESGIWYGQVDPGALPARDVDCKTDGSSRVVAGTSGDVVNCIAMGGVTYTVLGRPMRIFQVSRPILLA
jgi:hypothetical protein